MRSALTLGFSALFALQLTACSTTGSSSDTLAYDGSADDMDSLPDCSPDTQGSLFWVKSKNTAFECDKGNEWKAKKNAKKPDDEVNEDYESMTPRIVK